MVLMAGHFSATGAESQSTTNGWPAPFGRYRLVKPADGENLAEVGTAGLARRRIVASGQNAPKPSRKKTCRPGWRPQPTSGAVFRREPPGACRV